jgi:hypothetical protein
VKKKTQQDMVTKKAVETDCAVEAYYIKDISYRPGLADELYEGQ